LYELGYHNSNGIPSYLLGHFRRHGWWQYFPVAFLVKTPTGVLAGCAIAAYFLWRRRGDAHSNRLLIACLALPPVVYFTLSLFSSFNIGVRHILPIYPFLYVLLAWSLLRHDRVLNKATGRIAAIVALCVAVESISVYPHYLPFFNWASGGPRNGSRYLLDSNIDWGQDLANLGDFIKKRGVSPICTALFTAAPVEYYGIVGRDLNVTGIPEGAGHLPCAVAVSVNLLQGLYNSPNKFAALRKREPLARIGNSIYVYDLPRE